MNNLLMMAFVFFLFLMPNGSKVVVPQPEIDKGEAEGLVAFIINDQDGGQTDDNKVECPCGGSKKIVHGDGHVTPCPCDVCNCDQKKSNDEPPVQEEPVALNEKYLINKWTATWCAPCKTWDRTERPLLEKDGYIVEEIDYDDNKDLARRTGVSSIPTIWIIDKETKETKQSLVYPTYKQVISAIEKLENGN